MTPRRFIRGLAPRRASAVSGASRLGRLGASANPVRQCVRECLLWHFCPQKCHGKVFPRFFRLTAPDPLRPHPAADPSAGGIAAASYCCCTRSGRRRRTSRAARLLGLGAVILPDTQGGVKVNYEPYYLNKARQCKAIELARSLSRTGLGAGAPGRGGAGLGWAGGRTQGPKV